MSSSDEERSFSSSAMLAPLSPRNNNNDSDHPRRRSQPIRGTSISGLSGSIGAKSPSSRTRRSDCGLGLNLLEKQWSTSNITTFGEVVPGFTKRDSAASSRGSFQRASKFNSVRNIDLDGNAPATFSMDQGPPPPPSLPQDSPIHGGPSSRTILHSLTEDSTAITSCIHDAARITNWRTVNALSKSHAHCAKYTGQDRWTPLHHTCSRRCAYAEVYASLITAYPDALLALDEKGWTPLHHACRFKAPYAAVRHLLHLYPTLGKQAATRRCNRGRTALYYAIRYDAPAGVMELLLEADPTAVLDEDRDGVNPLSIVWDKYASSIEGKRTLHSLLKVFENECAGESLLEQSLTSLPDEETVKKAERRTRDALGRSKKLKSKWDKANMLLRAAFRFPLQEEEDEKLPAKKEGVENDKEPQKKKRTWRVLHATSAIKCHSTLFLLARALHPEQAFELDEGDLFGSVDNNDLSQGAAASQVISPVLKSNRTALHFACASPACGKDGRSVIRSLLSLNPDAAQEADDVDGSLPLHLISENERKVHWVHDGVRDVFQAFPDAVEAKDKLGRTPLHRAAATIGHGHSAPALAPSPSAAEYVASVIQNLILASPKAASIADSSGRLPLHCIAEHGEGWDNDTEAILTAHKAAVRARTGTELHNRLPIHLAAASPDAMPGLLHRLVEEHRRGVTQADRVGKLPLHLACESGKSWDRGVGILYDAYAPAISQPEGNKRGWMALHMAAASPNASASLIGKLAKLNPEAANKVDKLGRYPLHWACLTGKGWERGGMKAIFEAAPNVAMVEDSQGLLPFHAAALSLCEANKSAVVLGESTGDANEMAVSNDESSPDEEEQSSSHEVDHTDTVADGDLMETERSSKGKADPPEILKHINIIYQLLNLEPSVLIMK